MDVHTDKTIWCSLHFDYVTNAEGEPCRTELWHSQDIRLPKMLVTVMPNAATWAETFAEDSQIDKIAAIEDESVRKHCEAEFKEIATCCDSRASFFPRQHKGAWAESTRAR